MGASIELSMLWEITRMVLYLIINAPLFGTDALGRHFDQEKKMHLQVRKIYKNIDTSELVAAEMSNNPRMCDRRAPGS